MINIETIGYFQKILAASSNCIWALAEKSAEVY